jgi:hypothetical protein
LGAKQLAQLREVRLGDAGRRERSDGGLDDAAELDDVAQRMAARDEGLERTREVVRRDVADERAAAGAGLDDAEELERAQRLADGRPGDLELLGERALGGELISRTELAALEQCLDLLDDPLVELAASDRLDRGQEPAPFDPAGPLGPGGGTGQVV